MISLKHAYMQLAFLGTVSSTLEISLLLAHGPIQLYYLEMTLSIA
jgi:hypothetical protein